MDVGINNVILKMYFSVLRSIIFPSLLVVAFLALKIIYKRYIYSHSKLSDLDTMSGSEFEDFLAVYFRNRGYSVLQTGKFGDFGGDLVITKNNIKTVVQAKRSRNQVTMKAVQEVLGAKGHYQADCAMVATNNYLTRRAYKLAMENGVEVITRKDLSKIS